MRARYVGSLLPISTTSTDPERTYPWGKTHPKCGSTTRNRPGRGRSPSGWTATSLRTTSSLNIGYVLMMFSRSFPLHPLHLLLARPQVLRFCAQIWYSSSSPSPCHGSHGNPPARHTEFSLRTIVEAAQA